MGGEVEKEDVGKGGGYGRQDLLNLNDGRVPTRAVRKRLFELGVWRPRRARLSEGVWKGERVRDRGRQESMRISISIGKNSDRREGRGHSVG